MNKFRQSLEELFKEAEMKEKMKDVLDYIKSDEAMAMRKAYSEEQPMKQDMVSELAGDGTKGFLTIEPERMSMLNGMTLGALRKKDPFEQNPSPKPKLNNNNVYPYLMSETEDMVCQQKPSKDIEPYSMNLNNIAKNLGRVSEYNLKNLYCDQLDPQDMSTPKPERVVYQDVSGFKNKKDWYENNPRKDLIYLEDSYQDRSPLINNCEKSERYQDYLKYLKSPTVEGRGVSDVSTGNDQLTNEGISKNWYNKYTKEHSIYKRNGYPESVVDLTENQIDNLYCQGFYKPNRIETINDENLAKNIFDSTVNIGPNGVRLLQNAINSVTGRNIKVDGTLGTETVSILNNLSKEDLIKVNNKFVDNRLEYYKSRNKPHFLRTWTRRAEYFRR